MLVRNNSLKSNKKFLKYTLILYFKCYLPIQKREAILHRHYIYVYRYLFTLLFSVKYSCI